MRSVVLILGFDPSNRLVNDVSSWTADAFPGMASPLLCSANCKKTASVITGTSTDPTQGGALVSVFTQDAAFKPAESYVVPFTETKDAAGAVTATALNNAKSFVSSFPPEKLVGKTVLIIDPDLESAGI